MTNSTLKKRVISDIDYIKSKSENLEKSLLKYQLSEDLSKQIQSIIDYFVITDFSFIEDISQENLLIIKNAFSPYKHALETYINYSDSNNLNKFIDAHSKIYEFIENVINTIKEAFSPVNQENITDEHMGIQKRLDEIEVRYDNDLADFQKKSDKIIENFEEKSKKILVLSGRDRDDVLNCSSKANGSLDEMKKIYEKTKEYINNTKSEIEELKTTSKKTLNHNISMVLSEQFHDKAGLLKDEAEKKLGILSLKPWNFSGFYGAMAILLFVNFVSWTIYFSCELNIDFWEYMMLKLTINIPLIIYVAFALNEYTKAKKLYEEFDYKRIMSITLVNNYDRLKNELGLEQDKAFELIRTPFEKIFDNPVHSIYGDKSGDKNIGLDQLEKITSIIEKMKSK